MSDFNNHTTKQVHELYQDIKGGRLILNPDFQRRLVWNTLHKTKFIETILKDFPFPEIYIADRGINLEDITSKKVVVDGQQRMNAIVSYIDGTLELDKKIPIPKFSELSDEKKTQFLGYEVKICNIFGATEAIIKEIFQRINLTRYPLNSYEINNAVYDGEFITAGTKIAESIDWDNYPVLNHNDISRMRDVGLILNFMALKEEGGYFAYDNLVEDYIERYNDEYSDAEGTKKILIDTFELVKKLDLDKKSMWFNKSNFYTLIAEFILNEKNLPNISKLKNNLIKFEKLVEENKDKQDNNDYGKYYSYMYTGTNKRAERLGRGQLFEKYILDKK